jgi:hypothetical protein
MSDSNRDQKRELERQRLASDLMQLAKDDLNPDLKAHCVAMAKIWSGETNGKPAGQAGIQSVLRH